jgi:hypothetical protein
MTSCQFRLGLQSLGLAQKDSLLLLMIKCTIIIYYLTNVVEKWHIFMFYFSSYNSAFSLIV